MCVCECECVGVGMMLVASVTLFACGADINCSTGI